MPTKMSSIKAAYAPVNPVHPQGAKPSNKDEPADAKRGESKKITVK